MHPVCSVQYAAHVHVQQCTVRRTQRARVVIPDDTKMDTLLELLHQPICRISVSQPVNSRVHVPAGRPTV